METSWSLNPTEVRIRIEFPEGAMMVNVPFRFVAVKVLVPFTWIVTPSRGRLPSSVILPFTVKLSWLNPKSESMEHREREKTLRSSANFFIQQQLR
jgi:hypothetical protein